jgi:hypothetical protein
MSEQPKLVIDFRGPFAWPDLQNAPSVFSAPEGKSAGIYLWTVPTSMGYLVYYVGQTGRSFRDRFLEHYKEHAAGLYHLYVPEDFIKGRKTEIWPGRYDRDRRKSLLDCISNYGSLAPSIAAIASTYRFLLAPLEADTRIRQRVEAALATAFSEIPGEFGEFQEEGIVYRPRRPAESPIACDVRASVDVVGLPATFTA